MVLPVRAYGDGRTLAYILYGSSVGAGADPLVCMVTSTGDVQMGVRGQLCPYPTPEWKPAFFATLFPQQYVDSIAGTTTTSLDQTRPRRELARWRGGAAQKIQVMQSEGGLTPAQQICMNKCKGTLSTCVTIAGATLLAGIIAAGWCAICIVIAVGVGTLVPPVGIGAFIGCGWGCSSAIAAIAGGLVLLSLCQSNFATCTARCRAMAPPGGGAAV